MPNGDHEETRSLSEQVQELENDRTKCRKENRALNEKIEALRKKVALLTFALKTVRE